MRTIRRLLYREILGATGFVMLAFLGLFLFIDLVGELDNVGKGGYTLAQALLVCALQVPGHVYELAPIGVLIGAIYALARLAQSSEFTILRTGGLGPGLALKLLAQLGLAMAAVTFLVGDFVAPWCDTQATVLESIRKGRLDTERGGVWLRDSRMAEDGEHRYTLNVGIARDNGAVEKVRIFEFGPKGELRTRTTAARATIGTDGVWQLDDVRISQWSADSTPSLAPDQTLDHLRWPSGLTRQVVASAVLPLHTMSTMALYTYMTHLVENDQSAQRYEIKFWKKALYPLACLVMMALALPFAYLHARSGGLSLKVFGGILLGISFVLLNNVTGHLGLIHQWTPWLAASLPSVLYLLMSLGAFSWLVRYR
jgi:lipopolysaccharide export system permease protein